jgi:endonuclease/exonuclease/phosphatase family metal-dependent hydrolase
MAGTTLSVRQLARHIAARPANPSSLRAVLNRPTGRIGLSVKPVTFSVMTHNMGLLVAPGNYLGTDRDGAIAEIITQISVRLPDVVGLCEVFSDGERETIRNSLRNIYPFFREGPDEADLESDGGLLLLSRHPITVAHDFIYRDCDGNDCYANKGMIHIRVQPNSSPTPFDVFFTHAQDISTDDGVSTLYRQINVMNVFIGTHGLPTIPKIIMGDINIPADIPQHYARMLNGLGGVRDSWTLLGNSVESGHTVVTDTNFHEDADDRPARSERLDYVLLKADHRAIPIVSSIEVLRIQRNGRFISDHFGVFATFDRVALVSG